MKIPDQMIRRLLYLLLTVTMLATPGAANDAELLRAPLPRNSSMTDTKAIPRDPDLKLVFEGDWSRITDKDYKTKLKNLFYEFYPRIYARWGTGAENKKIKFYADPDPDAVGWSCGDEIGVGIGYANEYPEDIGFFAHELTHQIQSYECPSDWFCEGMASYGGFRYFHWAHEDTLTLIDQHADSIADWRYEPYGDCLLFFAYLDSKYPTRKNSDGSISYGLIDAINFGYKNGTIKSDAKPGKKGTSFNKVVKKITGVNTIEKIRQRYVKECMNGTWVFTGFADYEDNFLTEEVDRDLPVYFPVLEEAPATDPVAKKTSKIIKFKDNIFAGAKVIRSSGFLNDEEQDAFLIDDDRNTKWCSTTDSTSDMAYAIEGARHYILIDLGEKRSFNAYTVYNAGSVEDHSSNASSWSLLVSDDCKIFTPVDYQVGSAYDAASFETNEVSCRYVLLKVFAPDDGGGTVRLYELEAGMKK